MPMATAIGNDDRTVQLTRVELHRYRFPRSTMKAAGS